jgi:hypothetical protein
MSLALSTVALTQSVNGSTATLNSNADELFRILTGDNPDCVMNCSKALGGHEGRFQTDVLNPLNFSASFQLAQSSQQTTTTTGQASGTTPTPVSSVSIPTGAGKLTAIGAKFQLKNKYDPRSSAFQTLWQSQVTSTLGSNASTLASDVNALYAVLDKDATFKSAETDTSFTATLFNNATSDSSGKALLTAFENLWNSDLNTALNDPKLPAAVATVIKDRADFRQAWASALASAAGTMLSIQYNYNQPLNQPKTHDITVIGGYNWGIWFVDVQRGSLHLPRSLTGWCSVWPRSFRPSLWPI